MRCLDCDATGVVGVCTECGAAVCRQHVVVSPVHLTAMNGDPAPVEPAARQLRCTVCSTAYTAATT